ncbi:dnaJ homolog subfamily C member 25 [Eurytemora carolleeae]|uniref:dnaJ homolog subfamily C member 25 n=1 Tax=Eurytemora carolleeae TaxID=1294199 RepID=UPI000C779158|nr:dnaJ homolog subfamily C member 25 [Eurytemora carolleeae]XP_023330987.1 dnaJ homolog subfamily C member 25 [Eurytemora carolleeae]XP_023330988.1 dnaJ homolog subfamily C member 25 [Eurytemora carolleeae]|eukprot:XP_023330986.1 dnaJ homolog subfamily C member 25-like [Eurytemora affinis]
MWINLLCLVYMANIVSAQYEDLYCGELNCYDLLGVTRDSNKAEISKAYRKLAGQWHPDRFREPAQKKEAETRFMRIAAGYEVLRDEESRKEYDYMMDHPEEYFANYYRYYKRRVAPQVDVRVVLLSLISIVSALQYYSAWYNFNQAIIYLASVPKYRIQALEIAKSKGLAINPKQKGVSKEQIRKLEEELVRNIIADMMDSNGGYEKPQVRSILWVQIVSSPLKIYTWTRFQADWIWRFCVLRQDYGDMEKEYLVRTNLKLSEKQWAALSDLEKDGYMSRELWVRENWEEYVKEEEERERIRHAESGRSKQERRWLKNSDNRMTFDENYDW